jgi:hypothetical protein
MANIDYASLLSDAQKRNILTQRLDQFSSEAYQHSLNLQVAEASNNPEGVTAATEALAILDTAINVHQDALAALPATPTE